jgi:hypothetical protein
MKHRDIFKSVAVIGRMDHGECHVVGNGFFVSESDQWYLATCRHVLKEATLLGTERQTPTVVLGLKMKGDEDLSPFPLQVIDENNKPLWLDCTEIRKDVAVVSLNRGELSAYDIEPWTESDFLRNSDLRFGDKLSIFSHPPNYGLQPKPFEFPATFNNSENDDTGIIDRGLCPGNSGSCVYRVETPAASESPMDEPVQLVGVFCGALFQNPAVGYFMYTDILISILQGREDCFDKSFLSFDELTELQIAEWHAKRNP